ncbi:unnamed protein product, partial [Prorocentrum cordatum]
MQELSSLAPKITPDASLRHFLTIALPVERQHTRGLRDHEFLVLRPDDLARGDATAAADAAVARAEARDAASRPRMPLTVVLDNLRSAFNVGSIFRTAECLRAEQLCLCGYTAAPEPGDADGRGQGRAAGGGGHTARAAMGADAHVPWSRHERAADAVAALRARGVPVFALETVEGATPLHELVFPSPCALLLGNERHGLEADLLGLCSAPVRIPCHGVKNSLNVAVAFAICAYEVARQWQWAGGGSDAGPAGGGAGGVGVAPTAGTEAEIEKAGHRAPDTTSDARTSQVPLTEVAPTAGTEAEVEKAGHRAPDTTSDA